MRKVIVNLDRSTPSSCNNATWVLGEMTMQMEEHVIGFFLPAVLNKLIPMMNNDYVQVTLHENIGGLGTKDDPARVNIF